MKKYLIIGYILTYSLSLIGQIRDYRGQLIPEGRVTELSVSPDERLWIGTYLGALYYSNNFDSAWHICDYPEIFNFSLEDEYANKPMIDRISFFDSEQAIMTGYIALEKWGAKNGIYQTIDGGITWTPIDFGGDMWVYDAYVNNKGQAWIGGSSGKLYYSSDFGITWKKLPSLSDSENRISSINMLDSLNGYLGIWGKTGKSNEYYLLHTQNNWNSFSSIETPANLDPEIKDFTVDKLILWKNKIVIKQGGKYYYSDTSKIDWKRLEVALLDICIDNSLNKVFGITDSLEVIEFSDFNSYSVLNNYSIKRKPKTIKSINDCIYILDEDNELYKIQKDRTESTLLYSNEIQISSPFIQDTYNEVKAGVEGKQILLFDDTQNKWYRSCSVDFYIYDFYLKNSTEAILWDGENSYVYNLTNKQLEIFKYDNPLNDFLLFNIEEVAINCGQSCGYSGVHGVSYDQIIYKNKDSLLHSDTYLVFSVGELGTHRKEKTKKYKSLFKEIDLSTVLRGINENPYYVPTFRDAEVNSIDKIYNSERVKQINSKSKKDEFERTVQDFDKHLNENIDKYIKQNESVLWSTCDEWFAVTIINENSDTLTFAKQYYADSKAYHFPWTVNFGKLYFTSYSIDFSKMIDAILPEEFRGKEYFDNNVLLIELNDYLNK